MIDINKLSWEKMQGLMPAIIQDAKTLRVLMLGYMNKDALTQTIETKTVTFYSRSKQRLWVKGETSGNQLKLIDITYDCDADSLLVYVEPVGPTCHQGTESCFQDSRSGFIEELSDIIRQRYEAKNENSYVYKLFQSGIQRIAQKVGEEAVEVVIAAVQRDRRGTIYEGADLLFHLLVLFQSLDLSYYDILQELKDRNKEKQSASERKDRVSLCLE